MAEEKQTQAGQVGEAGEIPVGGTGNPNQNLDGSGAEHAADQIKTKISGAIDTTGTRNPKADEGGNITDVAEISQRKE